MGRRRALNPLKRNVTIRMTDQFYERLEHVAEMRNLSVGTLVRTILERTIAREERAARQEERGELARERDKVIHRIAARKVETVWRQKMIPTCPHCHHGIRPEDGLGDSAICPELDEARRRGEW